MKQEISNILFVTLGGGIGAASRYSLSNFVHRFLGSSFPYGTLTVNILGCLLIGMLMTMFEERFLVNPSLRIFFTIGILGGFTTFSTFSYETIMMLKDAEFLNAGLNIIGSVALCLGATHLGMILGKIL
ncbi:MAG: fluoride efflux transporter CrcB [Ignavibacteriae bacterium]|nr:fluoride efflux transporter CrcB [Ignavibacteriota bacterium]